MIAGLDKAEEKTTGGEPKLGLERRVGNWEEKGLGIESTWRGVTPRNFNS